ncbi:MAG TPA: hypothetical protein VD789_11070 [Thermomicrobiales bacterium]|nr:hypothetical protein [Thermomicrobiales bacterium]
MTININMEGSAEVEGAACSKCGAPVRCENVTIADKKVEATLICTACGHEEQVTIA